MKNIIWSVLAGISFSFSQAQHPDKVRIGDLLEKSYQFYENKRQFQLKTSYQAYSSYVGGILTESYPGIYMQSKSNRYTKINKTEFVVFSKYNIKVDNESK